MKVEFHLQISSKYGTDRDQQKLHLHQPMKFLWRKSKVTNTIWGKHPSEYDLDSLCSSDHKHAKQFLTDLVEYQLKTGKKVSFVNILDPCNPTQSRVTQVPDCSIISDFSQNLQKVRDSQMSLSEKTEF